MKKLLLIALPASLLIASCGETNKEETVHFANEADSLSYAIASLSSNPLASDTATAKKMNLELILKGFKENIKDIDVSDCETTMRNLFGPSGMSFDSTFVDAGSECIGKILAADFYKRVNQMEMMDRFNNEMLIKGFEHGLYLKDTLISDQDKQRLIQKFSAEAMEAQNAKMAVLDGPFLEEAKSRPNTEEIDGGIIIETLEAGNGGSPGMYDDVEAHYILTNTKGDTMESSFDRGEPLQMNLQQVIKGWTFSFPHMKKGGRYRIFIPSDLAYRQGALSFYIELLDFGPAGSLAAPVQQYGGGY